MSCELFLFICWALSSCLRNRLIHFLHKCIKKFLSLLTVQNCLTYLLLGCCKILRGDILDWRCFSIYRTIFSRLIIAWSYYIILILICDKSILHHQHAGACPSSYWITVIILNLNSFSIRFRFLTTTYVLRAASTMRI